MLESVFYGTSGDISFLSAAVCTAMSLILGLGIAGIHMYQNQSSRNFLLTLVNRDRGDGGVQSGAVPLHAGQRQGNKQRVFGHGRRAGGWNRICVGIGGDGGNCRGCHGSCPASS